MAKSYRSAVSTWSGCRRSRRIMSETLVCSPMGYPKSWQTHASASLSRRVMPGMHGCLLSVSQITRLDGPSLAVSRRLLRTVILRCVKTRSTNRRHRCSQSPPTRRGLCIAPEDRGVPTHTNAGLRDRGGCGAGGAAETSDAGRP